MLIRPVDAAHHEREWRALLTEQRVGQLIVARPDDLPDVVPTHFAYDGDRRIEMHLARSNPVWNAIGDGTTAVFSVVGTFVYVPSSWNAGPGAPTEHGVPTSYYAAVVAEVEAIPVDEPVELAAMVTRLLGRFQPEGGHAPVEAGEGPYATMLPAIRGLRLDIVDVQAKFKFGGNKTPEHQREIAVRLSERDGPGDRRAREHQLRRLGTA